MADKVFGVNRKAVMEQPLDGSAEVSIPGFFPIRCDHLHAVQNGFQRRAEQLPGLVHSLLAFIF